MPSLRHIIGTSDSAAICKALPQHLVTAVRGANLP